MSKRFIKVIKDNRSQDRGFIAIDAICSVFENKEEQNVSIMTMDGFWYDVSDNVEELFAALEGAETPKKEQTSSNGKVEYYRRKKMLAPDAAHQKAPQKHEFEKPFTESRVNNEAEDIFKGHYKKTFGKKPKAITANNGNLNDISKDLPTGVGEGHYDLNPKVVPPPVGKGL